MPVLVLNSAYYPLKVISNQRAAVMVFKDVARPTEFGPIFMENIDGLNSNMISFKSLNGYFVFNDVISTSSTYMRKRNIAYPTNRAIYERDDYICCYCHVVCDKDMATVDHVLPISKGGKTSFNNLVTCCTTCNREKGNMELADYLEQTGKEMLYTPYIPTLDVRLFKRKNKPHWNQYLQI